MQPTAPGVTSEEREYLDELMGFGSGGYSVFKPDPLNDSCPELPDSPIDPAELTERYLRVVAVRDALEMLSPDHKAVMVRHLDEMTQAEIAAELGISQGEVSKRMKTAMRKMALLLAPHRPATTPTHSHEDTGALKAA